MIDTLAFDFGQVIGFFDHGRTLAKLVSYTDFTAQQIYAAVYDGELEDAFESGRIGEPEFLARFRTLCRLRCDEDFLAAAIADIFWPNEPLCALLPQLKQRYRLVLGSNTNPIHARRFLAQFADELRYFDASVLSFEIGARKPGRGFYEHVIRAARCPPERCVFVDDLPANVAGARASGLEGIVYANFETLREALLKLGINCDPPCQ
jgi:glucose-1-phosphatase